MRSLLELLAASVVVASAACASAPTAQTPTSSPAAPSAAPAGPSAAAQPALKPAGEAKVGDRTRCPTSGEEFVVSESSPKVEYKGKTYYFCCGGCDRKFAQDPEKYLNAQPGRPDA
jgi:YHS domain-containing protein